MRIRMYCLLAVFWPVLNCYCQNPGTKIRPLQIGDTIPGDLELTNVYNYPVSKIQFSRLRGKLVILDFWETYCSSCLKALKKFDEIQTQQKEEVQIFALAKYGTKDEIFSRVGKISGLVTTKLAFCLNNDLVYNYFPHELISHVVWIDKDGVVRAITGSEYAKIENVQSILRNERVSWPVKSDVLKFNYEAPLLQVKQSSFSAPKLFNYSTLTGHIDGIAATNKTVTDSLNNRIVVNNFNENLLQICDAAISGHGGGTINPKLLILNVRDKDKYIFNNAKSYYADWEKTNTYCYSATFPLSTTSSAIREFIKSDIANRLRVSGIDVKKERRLVSCLVLLSDSSSLALLQTKHGHYINSFNENNNRPKSLRNAAFSNLLWTLNEDTDGIPLVINETSISKDQPVDIDLDIDDFKNIPALNKELTKYGLKLCAAQREIEMYIITESQN